MTHGGLCLRTRLAETAGDLSTTARRLLGLLAGVDARQLPKWAPVAAFGDQRGQSAVDELVSAHLVERVGGAYVVPELVREFAAGHVRRPRARCGACSAAGCTCWTWRTSRSTAASSPSCAARPQREVVRPDPTLRTDPLGWLESERTNLCDAVTRAAGAGLDEQCWELAHRLVTLFESRADYDGWQRTHDIALAATEAAGNRRGSAVLRCGLASLHINQSRFDLAHEMTVPAKDVFEDLGERAWDSVSAYRNLGIVRRSSDDHADARRWYQRALAVFERHRRPGRSGVRAAEPRPDRPLRVATTRALSTG